VGIVFWDRVRERYQAQVCYGDAIDLDKVTVTSGFGEVGPWGSSRTRWEIETKDLLTLEECIETASMAVLYRAF
jgi:3-oxoacyl-ACP reductase-like protein